MSLFHLGAVVDVINYTCVFGAMTCQNVCCGKVYWWYTSGWASVDHVLGAAICTFLSNQVTCGYILLYRVFFSCDIY